MNLLAQYTKAVVALLGGLSAWGITAAADGHYSQPELWGLVGIAGTALTVALAGNADSDDQGDDDA